MKQQIIFNLLSNIDKLALIIFFICWLGYEPLLKKISKASGVISKDLSVVRNAWMENLTSRSNRLFDSNLLGHSVNSASFFASASLIVIAALGGAIFEGHITTNTINNLGITTTDPKVFELKLGLVLICLVRGLLNFIWSLRQINYCAAAFGAIPDEIDKNKEQEFSTAIFNILEPAMSYFSQGVRGYYFALAASLWLYGAIPLLIGTIGAILLLAYRQSSSQAAKGIRQLRTALENHNKKTNS